MEKLDYQVSLKGTASFGKIISFNEVFNVGRKEALMYESEFGFDKAFNYLESKYPGIQIKGGLIIEVDKINNYKIVKKRSWIKRVLIVVFLPLFIFWKIFKVIIKA